MREKEIVVVVPIYQTQLSKFESISLTRCFEALKSYPIICVKPKQSNLGWLSDLYKFEKIISFDNSYFEDIQGYNKLMLSTSFYKELLDFEFVLIYQLDAFVLTDNLEFWYKQGYDYIGAPWLRFAEYPDLIKMLKSKFLSYYYTKVNKCENGIPVDEQFENKVGNGGFSLRRIKKFHELTQEFDEKIQFYNSQGHHKFHEDVFWSIEVNRKSRRLSIPDYRKAAAFSFETDPDRCLQITKGNLPFGCHAWDKNLVFWRPHFKKLGYDI